MKRNTQPPNDTRTIEEIKAKQTNTLWPDALLNSRNVDEFLWRGSPDAPLVQRIGAWVFGVAFMLVGVGLIEADLETTPDRKSILAAILGVVSFGVGLRVFLHGFRRRKRKKTNSG